jgi:hypothetical protein
MRRISHEGRRGGGACVRKSERETEASHSSRDPSEPKDLPDLTAVAPLPLNNASGPSVFTISMNLNSAARNVNGSCDTWKMIFTRSKGAMTVLATTPPKAPATNCLVAANTWLPLTSSRATPCKCRSDTTHPNEQQHKSQQQHLLHEAHRQLAQDWTV